MAFSFVSYHLYCASSQLFLSYWTLLGFLCLRCNSYFSIINKLPLKTSVIGLTAATTAPPKFLKELEPTKVEEGDSVKLEAQAAPTQDGTQPEVQWFRDGSPILAGDAATIKEKPDGTVSLEIAKAKPDDKGTYSVKLLNPAGEAESRAPLDVSRTFNFIQVLLWLFFSIHAFHRTRFCFIFLQQFSLLARFFLACSSLVPGPARLVLHLCECCLLVLASQLSAKITCLTNNSTHVAVKSSSKPVFLWKLSPLSVPVGEPIELKIKVTLGDDGSLPQIQWLKDNVPIPASDVDQKTEALSDGSLYLRVAKSRPEHSGQYSVRAQRGDEKAETSAPVNVISMCLSALTVTHHCVCVS